MTPQVYSFVKTLKLSGKTLDVGSRDINGSVRPLFSDYLGVDMEKGKNVDIQAKSNALPFKDSVFENVVCLEMLEHDEKFWESIPEMVRVLKANGTFVITARGIGFHKHGYPKDYWRFTEESIRFLLKDLKNVFVTEQTGENGVFGYGRKK